ncbi:aldehyde dehydrogenase family protein [Vibrio hepatarius]|uniref:aldehyde dehydrogenase family protein n=1 Tax=Vibrio hepatarius TaxID=171383 RepID=UPI00148D8891|nr:aldehyde dehydrogenase family protein [Vibrio hepatarius]NOI13994.1 aldehyde dehydrogenase family protein [Vibrio hepatarius]
MNNEQISASLNKYLATEHIGSWVNGEIILGHGQQIDLVQAHDEQVLLSYQDADNELVATLNEATDIAQQAWWQLPAKERGRVMYQIGAEIRKEAEALAWIECLTANKPLANAKGEIAAVADMFEYYAGWTDKLHGEVIPVPTSHLNYVKYEAIGTILQITPWNAPIFTAGWQIAPAIAAGNAVILKPSELTPVSSLILASLIERAGAPKGLVNVVAGYGHTIGQQIIASADIGKVCFVGSPMTGSHIASAAAKRTIPCVLELGGKSANIVFEDADLDKAMKGAMSAIFGGSGQSCVSGSRLLVQETIFDKFVASVAAAAEQIKVGNPTDPSSEIGPINNQKQYQHVTNMLEVAKAEGARVIGERTPTPDASGFYINPTVLSGDNGMQVAQQEVFGPVVIAIPFKDEADAIRIANDSAFGLAGAVWTNNVARAHRVADKVKAGTFWINSYKTIHVSSPFGGYKQSGYGRSSGIDVLREYSETKSVWVETSDSPAFSFNYGTVES